MILQLYIAGKLTEEQEIDPLSKGSNLAEAITIASSWMQSNNAQQIGNGAYWEVIISHESKMYSDTADQYKKEMSRYEHK